jgi:nitrite reductase/ring-hydroxylating ferredoxin subunit
LAVKLRRDSRQGEFIRVAGSEDVHEAQLWQGRAGKRLILLTRWEGGVIAVDAACPHAAADMGQGTLHRWKLCCPDHGYCFDIRSGAITWPEDEAYRLRRYATREENGSIFVQLD